MGQVQETRYGHMHTGLKLTPAQARWANAQATKATKADAKPRLNRVGEKQVALGFLIRDLSHAYHACSDHPGLLEQLNKVQAAMDSMAVWILAECPDLVPAPTGQKVRREYEVVLKPHARTNPPNQQARVREGIDRYIDQRGVSPRKTRGVA